MGLGMWLGHEGSTFIHDTMGSWWKLAKATQKGAGMQVWPQGTTSSPWPPMPGSPSSAPWLYELSRLPAPPCWGRSVSASSQTWISGAGRPRTETSEISLPFSCFPQVFCHRNGNLTNTVFLESMAGSTAQRIKENDCKTSKEVWVRLSSPIFCFLLYIYVMKFITVLTVYIQFNSIKCIRNAVQSSPPVFLELFHHCKLRNSPHSSVLLSFLPREPLWSLCCLNSPTDSGCPALSHLPWWAQGLL